MTKLPREKRFGIRAICGSESRVECAVKRCFVREEVESGYALLVQLVQVELV